MKLIEYGSHDDGTKILGFECPGCGYGHSFRTGGPPDKHPMWGWNGSMDSPTFTPSLLVYDPMPDGTRRTRCHSFVRDGNIQFLSDSIHNLAGKTVTLPEVDMD